jgi:hypothetical protein
MYAIALSAFVTIPQTCWFCPFLMSTPGIGAFGSLKRLFRKAVSVPDPSVRPTAWICFLGPSYPGTDR